MKDEPRSQRRKFIKHAITLSAAAFTPPLLHAVPVSTSSNGGDKPTFLFQGASITDGNRSRNTDWNYVMGHGYQYIIASKLWYDFPNKGLQFFNRGISGNKVTDLAVRWQQDTLDLKPNILSILIGINDTAACIDGNTNFTAAQYENDYRALLQQTKQQLPDIQLVLCEPFILRVGRVEDKWDEYAAEIKKRQEIVLKLSKEFKTMFVPFQGAFNNALSKAPADYWIWDGIHPMPAGHELMAITWMQQVSNKWKFIKQKQ